MLLNVTLAISEGEGADGPADEVKYGDGCDKNKPKPEEEEDHLVEEVDGQHTLDGVTLQVTQTTHFEVAHGDARESRRVVPVGAVGDGAEDVNAVHAEGVSEHGVEQEELANHVGDEEEFADEVGHQEIVSEPLANAAACTSQDVCKGQRAGTFLSHLTVGQEPGKHRIGRMLTTVLLYL